MNREIDNYMTIAEAAHRWSKSEDAIKMRLRQSNDIDQMVEDGLLKSFLKPGGVRKSWIISVDAMEKWYGENK